MSCFIQSVELWDGGGVRLSGLTARVMCGTVSVTAMESGISCADIVMAVRSTAARVITAVTFLIICAIVIWANGMCVVVSVAALPVRRTCGQPRHGSAANGRGG